MKESSSDKKQTILDTAEKLFAQYGYDPTSTREIAEKSGVNVAMISYYFGSKENLLKAIITRYGDAVLQALKKSLKSQDLDMQSKPERHGRQVLNPENMTESKPESHGRQVLNPENMTESKPESHGRQVLNPESRLKTIIDTYIRYAFAHPEPIVIAHREKGLSMRPEMQDSIHCVYTEIKEIIETAIHEGQQDGTFRDIDTQLFMFTVGGMLDHLVHELHTMQLYQADPAMYGVSGLDDNAFRDRFAALIWELVTGYLKKT
jgi:AcrR family transcriptional regulator